MVAKRFLPNSGSITVEPFSDKMTLFHAYRKGKSRNGEVEITRFPAWHTSCATNGLMNGAQTQTPKLMGDLTHPTEAHFRSLIENTTDIITILEADGSIRYESPSIERILGYKPEELVGRNAFEFIHPDDVVRVHKIFTEGLIR